MALTARTIISDAIQAAMKETGASSLGHLLYLLAVDLRQGLQEALPLLAEKPTHKERTERFRRNVETTDDCKRMSEEYVGNYASLQTLFAHLLCGADADFERRLRQLEKEIISQVGEARGMLKKAGPGQELLNKVKSQFPNLDEKQLDAVEELVRGQAELVVDLSESIKKCDSLLDEISEVLSWYRKELTKSRKAADAGERLTKSILFIPGLVVWGVASAFESRYQQCISTWEDYASRVEEIRANSVRWHEAMSSKLNQQPGTTA